MLDRIEYAIQSKQSSGQNRLGTAPIKKEYEEAYMELYIGRNAQSRIDALPTTYNGIVIFI
jgi:hypothetical protein